MAAPKGNKRAKKKAIPPPQPPSVPVITKHVITTQINGRQQFISHLSTTNQGGRFIPHYTFNRDLAKDFLSEGMALQYMSLMSDGVELSRLNTEMIDVPFHPTPLDPAGDGPNYEPEQIHISATINTNKFYNQIPQE